MNVYLDTFALVKLVVEEEGSEEAGAIWDAADVVLTNRISYAEARAALAMARRLGRLTPAGLSHAKQALEERFRALLLVEVTDDLVRSAGDLAEVHGLRGYDAVHLASALTAESPNLVMGTWDQDLGKVARRMGLDAPPFGRA